MALWSVLDPLRQWLVTLALSTQGTYLIGFIGILGGDPIRLPFQLLVFRLELVVLRSASLRAGEGGTG